MIGQFFNMFSSETLSVWAPITGNFNTYGYVVLHMPMTQVQQGQNEILNIVYMTSLVIFLLSLVILLVFTLTVYFPLKRITAGAMEYADGNLDYTIQVHTNDEMGYLANTLNYMSDELNKMEEYQKSFIANVSHDFRSPLTSIKGYLEAILDGTIPPELYDKYLNIVIAETERLNKLTGELREQIAALRADVDAQQKDSIRTTVLEFSNSLIYRNRHTKEEFDHILEFKFGMSKSFYHLETTYMVEVFMF